MKTNWLLTILPMLLLFAVEAAGESTPKYVLIVNKANKIDTLTKSKVRFIYHRKVSRWPWGAEILPLDLPERSPARRDFSQSVLGRSVEELAVYWIEEKMTRNANPPARVPTAAAAKAIVASRAGAICYIPANAVDDTVKVIEVK